MGYKVLDDNLTLANINSDKPKVCFLHGWGRSSKDFMNIENEFAVSYTHLRAHET